jgi:hypothetical protein
MLITPLDTLYYRHLVRAVEHVVARFQIAFIEQNCTFSVTFVDK